MTRSRTDAGGGLSRSDERTLLRLERQILFRATSIDWDGADELRSSIPHLVRTGGCGCGCGSFTVRDLRHPEQAADLEQWCDGVSPEGDSQVTVWLGGEGRLMAVDVVQPSGGPLPPTADLRVRWPAVSHDSDRRTSMHPVHLAAPHTSPHLG